MGRIALTCLLLVAAGCARFPVPRWVASSSAESVPPPAGNQPPRTSVYVTSNGFHTGLVVRKADVPRAQWPEVDEIPDHSWVEVGWGSEVFYRAEKITVPVALGAIVPNPSVLHVVGLDSPPEEMLIEGDLIRLEMDEPSFAALCRHIHESYDLGQHGRTQYLGRGIYGDSAFIRARGKYYFPNTCNVWTARGLKKSGVAIHPELCCNADAVLRSARGAGTTISRR